MGSDQALIDLAREERRNIGAGFDAVKQVKPARGDIRYARRKPESE